MSDNAPAAQHASVPEVSARTIAALALPALGVLAATPLYLLLDTAGVGRLGAAALAALAAGTTIQSVVTTQLTFLSYGTTARASRLFGAGRRTDAIAEGVQATYVAGVVGMVLFTIIELGAPYFTLWLAHDEQVAAEATTWLRVAAVGIPLILAVMAGNGWLRGIQNTRLPLYFTLAGVIPSALAVPILVSHLGIVGSAWANLLGQSITALCFLACLYRFHTAAQVGEGTAAHGSAAWQRWRPRPDVMRKQLVLGRDLIIRSLAFQIAFLSAAAVAGRFGAAALGAHQVLLQLWNFLVLTLDSLAIAAQTLTGAALGSGSVALARRTGARIIGVSTGFGAVLAVLIAAGFRVLPRLFTDSEEVLATMAKVWPLLIVMLLIGGVVFALDGVLLGASDARFLRTATLASVLFGFLPGVWLALWLDTGLVGVWLGLVAMLIIRLATTGVRFWRGAWASTEQP